MRWTWRGVAARCNVTDEEHVRRVRRTVAVYDRWRRPLLVFYAGMALALGGLLVATAWLLPGLMQLGMQAVPQGFFVGLYLGGMLGLLALKAVHGIVAYSATPRTERLLLRYYDALTELAQGSAAACDSVECPSSQGAAQMDGARPAPQPREAGAGRESLD